MMERNALRRWNALPLVLTGVILLLVAAFTALAPVPVSAEVGEHQSVETVRSLVGGYLSGRFAKSQHDIDSAATFYGSALAHDPDNEVLVEQAFLMELSSGAYDRASVLAEKLVELQPQHRLARLFQALEAYKKGDFEAADRNFKIASSGPIGELTAALLRSWLMMAQKKVSAALDLLDKPRQAEWAQFYLRYHRALIADLAGRKSDARISYQQIFKQDTRTLRTAMAYARHAAHAGDAKLAQSILREYDRRSSTDPHPLSSELAEEIGAGKPVALLIDDPTEGMSEVLYGLGEALTTDGGVSIGIVYLQMALYLSPRQPLALAALAQAYETTRNYQDAISTYDRIPRGTPLQDAIYIRKALNLNLLDKTDEAKVLLEQVSSRSPDDLAPLDALGNIMRARKRYDVAIVYYAKALKTIGQPDKRHWTFFYARGTCYERTNQWSKAEVDLKKAMQLSPDQPLVLNYLGYSWIDQGRNLREGLRLIKKAVSLKPDDGYIVDSLGWAYYRLGRYKDAVGQLERAVELRPDDPVLNDHLGDALWRVGREREARFQWDQALSLSPEADEIAKIRKKLADGLTAATKAKLPRTQASTRDQRRRSKHVDNTPKALQ